MRLSAKQKALALKLFGSDRLTRRQFNRAMTEYKDASKAAFDEANQYDILALTERHTALKKDAYNWYSGPCPMGSCKGRDRFVVDIIGNKAWCRACEWQYNGLGGGPVGFIANLYNLSAFEARDYIIGREISVDLPKIEQVKPDIKAKKEHVRLDFGEYVQTARQNLSSNDQLARWGRDYFASRGISERTLNHFGVGVVSKWGKPFVVMPFHSNTDLVCCAVRLRQAKIKKSEKGSIFQDASFGLDSIRGHEIGVIVEGEVNALSIWQALSKLDISADVLSVGSEGALKASSEQIVRVHLKAAKSLIVWADKEEKGHEARTIIEQVRPDLAVAVLHSKEKAGKKGKIDANDLLLAGHLGAVLGHVLPNADNAVTPTRTTCEKVEVQTGKNEILCSCGVLTEELGTKEAFDLYLQAEELYLTGTVSDLFAHYEQMKALKKPLTQAVFELDGVPMSQESNHIDW